MGQAALFLDRDGTLIEERGHLGDPEQAVFFPGTAEALRKLGGRFLLFIVTNQSGIAKGLIRDEDARRVNLAVVRKLAGEGVQIREVYMCPHRREDNCACMKPKPFFLETAARDHGIDLARSFVMGDHPSDAQLGPATGAQALYLLSGHGETHRHEINVPCEIVPGIVEACDAVARVHAARLLREGKLVAFPTETVYGLGADATNVKAVRRVFEIKGRPERHPLIVHLAGAEGIGRWAAGVPDAARSLAEKFWPGPLTLILRRAASVPDAVSAGQETVGLRVPAHPLALALLKEFGGGVAAPSANRFGKVSPTSATHVREDLGSDVDFILDGGPCAVGVESTIVDLSSGAPRILRPGGVTREALQEALGREVPVVAGGPVRAPGQMDTHYAPRAKVVISPPEDFERKAAALRGHGMKVLILGELPAQDLYAKLRDADAQGADAVIVTLPPEEGLGLAVGDRLRKAAGSEA